MDSDAGYAKERTRARKGVLIMKGCQWFDLVSLNKMHSWMVKGIEETTSWITEKTNGQFEEIEIEIDWRFLLGAKELGGNLNLVSLERKRTASLIQRRDHIW